MQAAHPDKSLNAGLTSCAASHHHHLSLCYTQAQLRHSSTLYDTHEPRLRLKHGGLVRYSSRLRQAQTTRRRSQASRDEQSRPATRRLPRQSITAQLQCDLTDSNVRRDVPATKHHTSFSFPLCPSPCDYKRERRATVTRVRLSIAQTPLQGTWARHPLPTSL
jgi:hypothetical protein